MKWYLVYNELTRLLKRFYDNHHKRPGQDLYDLLNSDSDFTEENYWFEKVQDSDVYSVDPVHLFSSLNGNKLREENRLRRIQILLGLLDSDLPTISKVDFDGCPAPAVIKMLSIRDKEQQAILWALFNTIATRGLKSINERNLKEGTLAYGLGLGSLSIFFFWMCSDHFLPLDKHTVGFILEKGITKSRIEKADKYLDLVNELDTISYAYNERWGSHGLFREITELAVTPRSSDSFFYTKSFATYLNNLKSKRTQSATEQAKNINKPTETKQTKAPVEASAEAYVEAPEEDKTEKAGLQLLALRPLKDCIEKMRKVLKEDEYYYFQNGYAIDGDTIQRGEEAMAPRIYDLNDFEVNVTAIVGKNGSGKSSLIELFFWIINNVAHKFKAQLNSPGLELIDGLKVELYYLYQGDVVRIQVVEEGVNKAVFTKKGSLFQLEPDTEREMQPDDLKEFFYTVAVSYSHYGLNTRQYGTFLDGLFHKNDAYQAPIVINPMRTEGNIDVNVENSLATARLLANLVERQEEYDHGVRKLTDTHSAFQVEFGIKELSTLLFKKGSTEVELDKLKDQETLWEIITATFKIPLATNKPYSEGPYRELAKKYLLRKLVRIAASYNKYNKYFNQEDVRFYPEMFLEYLHELINDTSHITYKLRQTIHYLKYDEIEKKDGLSYDLLAWSERLEEFKRTEKRDYQTDPEGSEIAFQNIELLPPPIYKATILLKEEQEEHRASTETEDAGKSKIITLEGLSSGQKQHIHSIHGLLYHLRNLNSVSSDLISYRYVNMVLDEVELYYHPEYQRTYLDELLKAIDRLVLNEIDGINICLATHSPFILSDVLDTHVLKLDKGNIDPKHFKTFGSNIHDLLKNSFFLEKGFIGAFAAQKISSVIEELSFGEKSPEPVWSQGEYYLFIQSIGEPLIKDSLMELYHQRYFESMGEIDAEIERLQQLKKNKLGS